MISKAGSDFPAGATGSSLRWKTCEPGLEKPDIEADTVFFRVPGLHADKIVHGATAGTGPEIRDGGSGRYLLTAAFTAENKHVTTPLPYYTRSGERLIGGGWTGDHVFPAIPGFENAPPFGSLVSALNRATRKSVRGEEKLCLFHMAL